MRLFRRSASGLYTPQRSQSYEYASVWDNFSVPASGTVNSLPMNGAGFWITAQTPPSQGTIVTSPSNSCNISGDCFFAGNFSTPFAQWVSQNSSSDTFAFGDQFAQVTYQSDVASNTRVFGNIGLCVRASGGTSPFTMQGYYGVVNIYASTWDIGVFVFNSGFVQFGNVGGGSSLPLTVTAGQRFTLIATGSAAPITVSYYQEGSLIGSVTGSFPAFSHTNIFATGAPGLMWGGGSDLTAGTCQTQYGSRVFCNNFVGGPLATAPRDFSDFQGSGYWRPSAPLPIVP